MSSIDKAIGVFDSGLGGISVLKELRSLMPQEDYLYYGDSSFAPYGVKTKEEITKRCRSICAFFISQGVKAVVIACNTATSACVKELRTLYPNLPIVGMEPALKPAVDGRHQQHVLVLATQFTLKEKKFEQLMSRFDEDNTIYRQPCPKLVELVEAGRLEDEAAVNSALREYLKPYDMKRMDSIVLGCTHFVFYRSQLRNLIGDHIALVDGNAGTARHVQELLQERGVCRKPSSAAGEVRIYNSLNKEAILKLSRELLER